MITLPPDWLTTPASPVEFIEAAFEDASGNPAPVRLWTGIGDRNWDGKTWAGVGDLIEAAPLPAAAAADGRRSWSIAMPATPAMVAEAASARTQGRLVKLWLGWLKNDGSLVDPVQIATFVADEIVVEDGADSALIRITCVDTVEDLDRPRLRRLSPETQAIVDPTDRGFDYVASMDRATVDVGRGYWRREARRAG